MKNLFWIFFLITYLHKLHLHGITVVSSGVVDAGCLHTPRICDGGRKSEKLKCFKLVNTMLGNLKNSLRGTCHSIPRKHTPICLAEFEYHFNRLHQLKTMIERLARVALKTPTMLYKLLTPAQSYG